MIIPPFLNKNSLIGLVSPAGKVDISEIERAQEFLTSQGFRHLTSPYAVDSFHQFSSTGEHRANDFQMMIDNPDIEAIWCTRGGYGTIRLLNKLNFDALKKKPKWLIGFSDITVLHSVFQNLGIASMHAPMCRNLKENDYSNSGMEMLWKFLKGAIPSYSLPAHELNRQGKANGTLIGGNLSLLYALKGSPYDFNPEGKILFIEDVGEYLYQLDRMMQAMKVGGKLSGLSGLVVGQMSEIKDNDTPFGMTAYQTIADAVSEYDYPVIFDFPSGHTERNEPLLFGGEVRIDVGADKTVLCWDKSN